MKSQKLAAILAVTVLGTCSMTFAENPIIRMNSIEVSAADVEATYIGSGYQLNYKTVDNNKFYKDIQCIICKCCNSK